MQTYTAVCERIAWSAGHSHAGLTYDLHLTYDLWSAGHSHAGLVECKTLTNSHNVVGAGGGSGVVGGLGGGVVGVLAQPKQLPLEHLQVSPEQPRSTLCPMFSLSAK